jgi:pimeloyl-ACP methyl ester carboxylesterase
MKEITFSSSKDGVKLHGTFSTPTGKSRGSVLFLVGSGKTDRDETTPAKITYSGKDEKLFVQLSDTLTKFGFTTFRYDKRGVLDSGRNVDITIWRTADREHLISDAIDAAKVLMDATSILPEQMIILGHSEGTIIATELAIALGKKVKAMLLFGAQARSMKDMLHYQIVESRSSEGSLESAEKEYQEALNMIANSKDDFAPDGKPMNWYHQFLASPANAERLALVTAKKIIFHGEVDPQTPLDEITKFKEAGVKDLTIHLYPGLGHGFSPDKLGKPTIGPIADHVLSDLTKSIEKI